MDDTFTFQLAVRALTAQLNDLKSKYNALQTQNDAYSKNIESLNQQNAEYSQTIHLLKIENAEQRRRIEILQTNTNNNNSNEHCHLLFEKQIHEDTIEQFINLENESNALRDELSHIKSMMTDDKDCLIKSCSSKVEFVKTEQNAFQFKVVSDFSMNDQLKSDDIELIMQKIEDMEKENDDKMELMLDGIVSSETSLGSVETVTIDDEDDDDVNDDMFSEEDLDEMEELFKKCDFNRPSIRIYQQYASKVDILKNNTENKFVWLTFEKNKYWK